MHWITAEYICIHNAIYWASSRSTYLLRISGSRIAIFPYECRVIADPLLSFTFVASALRQQCLILPAGCCSVCVYQRYCECDYGSPQLAMPDPSPSFSTTTLIATITTSLIVSLTLISAIAALLIVLLIIRTLIRLLLLLHRVVWRFVTLLICSWIGTWIL
jgi:hypothetical protein